MRDQNYILKERYRKRIYDAFRGRGRTSTITIELLGCDWETLVAHMESLFKPGMSWANYGKNGWEADHKKPCASFNVLNEEEKKECFHYTNLQPLWRKDNRNKGSLYNNKRHRYADHINRIESTIQETSS